MLIKKFKHQKQIIQLEKGNKYVKLVQENKIIWNEVYQIAEQQEILAEQMATKNRVIDGLLEELISQN